MSGWMDGRMERESRGGHGGGGGVSPPRLPTSGHRGAGGCDAQAHQCGKCRPHHHPLGKGRCGTAAAAAAAAKAAKAVFGVGRQELRITGVYLSLVSFVVRKHLAVVCGRKNPGAGLGLQNLCGMHTRWSRRVTP